MYGPLTVVRHALLKARGVDLRVFVRGVDVTNRCRYADDTPGRQVAELFLLNEKGTPYVDESARIALEIVETDVEIRPVPPGELANRGARA
jgi:hypothetical protein